MILWLILIVLFSIGFTFYLQYEPALDYIKGFIVLRYNKKKKRKYIELIDLNWLNF